METKGESLEQTRIVKLEDQSIRETFHVVQCLGGDAKGFLDEWEVNLKSILLNAPLDYNLNIHIICDEKACSAVENRLIAASLNSTKWRNEIVIHVKNVEKKIQEKEKIIQDVLVKAGATFDERIGIGGYLRLFAPDFIFQYTNDIGLSTALYMDTDVVLLSNLNGLIHSVKENTNHTFFSWRENSGFLVMNCFKFQNFFPLLNSVNFTKTNTKMSDQTMLAIFQENYPHLVGQLPMEWHNHIGHGYRAKPQKLIQKPNVGYLHFTGIDTGESYFSNQGLIKFCERGGRCQPSIQSHVTDFQKSWGLADYYIRITWEWVIFQGGTSRIDPKENEEFLTVVFQ
ncbi:hypothetical protein CTEN210_13104 [Chaetoceros tenuissimus]|uniref:Uncharacterized protein n=1 Tax=Chaetoceros tenuissimus TaxID=426638 RepID=A0AAD3HB52_9STRA|nr:hypothetical protein CTEN210_13104 [Chaetoceros tenuissimus]